MPQPYMLVPPQGSDQADEWMRLGLEAQVAMNLPKAQGYYNQALRIGREALAMKPCTETRIALAMVLGAAGLPEQALPLYDAILAEMPTHPAAGPNSCFLQT